MTSDLDGGSRCVGDFPDIGADEFDGADCVGFSDSTG